MSQFSILKFKPIPMSILGPVYFPDNYYAVAFRFTKWLPTEHLKQARYVTDGQVTQSGVHQCQVGMCLNVSGPLSQVPHCHHGQYHKPGPGHTRYYTGNL